MISNPFHGIPGWEDFVAPLRVHGDAGTFTKNGHSLLVLDFDSMLEEGDTL